MRAFCPPVFPQRVTTTHYAHEKISARVSELFVLQLVTHIFPKSESCVHSIVGRWRGEGYCYKISQRHEILQS